MGVRSSGDHECTSIVGVHRIKIVTRAFNTLFLHCDKDDILVRYASALYCKFHLCEFSLESE